VRPFPSLVLACLPVLVAPAVLAVPPTPADPRPAEGAVRGATPFAEALRASGDDVPQTSDGVAGAIARPRSLGQRGPSAPSAPTVRRTWQVAPGVTFTTWDETDARGPVRAHLLSVDWKQPGLSVDYANAGRVRRTAPLTSILRRDGAIAGVNGDFFDIGDTGAPLGTGRDRQRGLLHGRQSGWNSAFHIGRRGVPQIGSLPVLARVKQRPGIRVTNVNSPSVAVGGIGVYTPAWGRMSGTRVVDGQTRDVRMVQVRDGRVVRNTTRLPSGKPVTGRLLIGRGAGADALRVLRKGSRVTLGTRLQGNPAVAITGNQFLIDDGIVRVVDDRELHPRTAVGIDRDTHRLLFVVVDGRQSFSRGYTMVELAELMMSLGADEALNLDGGGSSTMVARGPGGRVGVVNSPSDGDQRAVPNGLGVTYTAP
jgi:hypothetical protein